MSLFIGGYVASASPSTPFTCARVKSQPQAWVVSRVDALVVAAHAAYEDDEALPAYERVLGGITGTIRRCELSRDEGFVSRYRELVEYVEAAALDQRPDHELGFVVPDRQYFAETRGLVQIPDFLTTRSFLRAASRDETLARAKSYLRQLNKQREPSEQLVFFSYKSRHLGTPDSDESYGRLLIVVPGNAGQGVPEKWVQFGVPDARRPRVRNVSVVSTIARPDGTSSVYFKDFYRTYRRDGSISIKGRWELGFGDDNCAQCHKSGILPIFPVAGSVSPDERQAVAEVNRRFRRYGSPRFDKYLDETKLGPGLGSATSADRNGRFGEDFVNSTLGRAMACAACHERDDLGALNWPMDPIVISSYVKGGMMPFGAALDDSQRGELYEKLIQEYFAADNAHPGILKSWLLGRLR
ncbi:MAG: cytochrome c [Acidobacteria bacterium]|nr:cytochrome c [Acidobacteriota bacterium]